MNNRTGLLIDDSQASYFQPILAQVLGGSDRAVLVQQVHYWCQRSTTHHEGRHWVYNSTKDWRTECLPWLCEKTVERMISDLVEFGVFKKAQLAKSRMDRRNFLAIDYERLNAMITEFESLGKWTDVERFQWAASQPEVLESGTVCRSRRGLDVVVEGDWMSQSNGTDSRDRKGPDDPVYTEEQKITPKTSPKTTSKEGASEKRFQIQPEGRLSVAKMTGRGIRVDEPPLSVSWDAWDRFKDTYPSRGEGESMGWHVAMTRFMKMVYPAHGTEGAIPPDDLLAATVRFRREVDAKGRNGNKFIPKPERWLAGDVMDYMGESELVPGTDVAMAVEDGRQRLLESLSRN